MGRSVPTIFFSQIEVQPGVAAHPPQADVAEPARLTLWLPFTVTLVLALAMFAYCAHQISPWSARGPVAAGQLPAWAGAALALLTLFVGGRWCVFVVLALVAYRRQRRVHGAFRGTLPPVSILVPAYNEAQTMEAALRSLMELDYPRYEVIVVDDGSSDATFELAKPFQGDYGRCAVRVYRKPNGGKWSALNFAFARSSGELVLCVDADSRLERSSLRRMVPHLADPRVMAVAGQVRVRNRDNLITRLQALEYVIANGLVRMAQSISGTVLVVPGPLGLFRRTALEEVYLRFGSGRELRHAGEVEGPFEGDTFAEDFDLSLAILALGGRCAYEPDAVSHTKAPDWSSRLLNQRYRWARGTFQVLRKFLRRGRACPELMRPHLVCWLGVTYALELVLMPLLGLCGLGFFVAFLGTGGSSAPLLGCAAAFMAVNLNASAFFIAMHKDRLSTLTVLAAYDFYHTFLINSGWVIAVIDEIRGRSMRW